MPIDVINAISCACKLKYLLLLTVESGICLFVFVFSFFTFRKRWVGRTMGNETFYQEDLKKAYLKSDTFLLHVPNEWLILIKNLFYIHLKTPAADPWKQIHYRTLPPIVPIVCLSVSQPILWDVPKSFVAIHSPPPPPPPVTPHLMLTINIPLHHGQTP